MGNKDFWNRIKNLCKEKGITQQDLSEKIGYGKRNLEIKIARESTPKMSEISNIAKIFDVSCDYLINGSPELSKSEFSVKDKELIQMLYELHPIEQNSVRTLVKTLYEQKSNL